MSDIDIKKIVFLDRDGTICTDKGAFNAPILDYNNVLNNIELIDGCKESLQKLKDAGFLLVVISNQAGVAKCKFKEADIHKFNKKLNILLDGLIDGFYYCIHHDTGFEKGNVMAKKVIKELIVNCGCRKPKTGMFLKCREDLKKGKIQYIDEDIINLEDPYKKDRVIYKKDITPCQIDIQNSFMIGDKYMDVVCGKNFDLKSILVLTGEGKVEYNKHKDMKKDRDYDYIAKDIKDATDYILNKN